MTSFPQTFNLAASTAQSGGNRVTAPLTGSVGTGAWITSQRLNVAAMPHGFIAYDYLLPAQYTTEVVYPILFYGHENTEGTSGNSYPSSGIWNQKEMNGSFNTVAFRTNFPCIVVVPYCDQSDGTSGTGENFGGYNDTPNSGGNEQGVNALLNYFKTTFPVDATRCYCTGDSLGAIGTLSWMVDNNRTNSTNRLWTAGMGYSDQLYRPGNGTPNNALFQTMTNVPYIAVSTPHDNNDQIYDKAAWTFYTGNSNYPSTGQLDSGGVAAIRAGTTNFYYCNDTTDSVPWDSYRQLNADGGKGTNLYTLLFSFIVA